MLGDLRLTNLTSVDQFRIGNDMLPNIQYHVYIPKEATQSLSDYIDKEYWGNDNVLLYKYLDYIWRLQLIDKMVKIFRCNNQTRLVFHTGLYSKKENKDVYMCLIPNKLYYSPKKPKNAQPWRVISENYENERSFLTKDEILSLYNLTENDLPIKTTFQDLKFNPKYGFVMNLSERVRTTKQRIMETLKDDIGFDGKMSTNDLEVILRHRILNGLENARKDPSIITKQVFIERDLKNNKKVTKGYHLELLLPFTINVNNKDVYFALVLRVNNSLKCYEGMSIITREMAYTNARLISKVNISWLKPFVNTNKILISNPCTPRNNNLFSPRNICSPRNVICSPRSTIGINSIGVTSPRDIFSPRGDNVFTPRDLFSPRASSTCNPNVFSPRNIVTSPRDNNANTIKNTTTNLNLNLNNNNNNNNISIVNTNTNNNINNKNSNIDCLNAKLKQLLSKHCQNKNMVLNNNTNSTQHINYKHNLLSNCFIDNPILYIESVLPLKLPTLSVSNN